MALTMTAKEKIALLKLARDSIANRLKGRKDDPESKSFRSCLTDHKSGVFVTLHKKGTLRGCIGNIEARMPVLTGIRKNACHAAFDDTRFAPLTEGELDEIDIEISILTSPEKINYSSLEDMVSILTPYKDGVIIEKQHCRATFLPQVWDQLPEPESFLSHLCTKAGLSAGEWRKGDLDIYTYQVQSFGEREYV